MIKDNEIVKFLEVKEENSIYIFDLSKFIYRQNEIFDKFKQPINGIELIDKYILQTLEEVYETDISNEPVDELIDVLMYLGSSLNTIEYEKEFLPVKVAIIKEDNAKELKHSLHDINNRLMGIRRFYPERKWHKKYSPDDIDCDRGIIVSNILIDTIKLVLSILINMTDIEDINSKLNKKQIYILGL